MREDGCVHCSNSFVNGIDPMYDGSAFSIGESDPEEPEYMMISAAGLNKPAPVTIEVWKWSEECKRNIRVCIFIPRYCPYCGRKLTENLPYLKKKAIESLKKAIERTGIAATKASESVKKLVKVLDSNRPLKPSPQMIAEGDCDGDCGRCKGIDNCWKEDNK